MFEREFDYDYIVFLKKLGLSLSEISKIIGCHVLTVGRVAKGVDTDLQLQCKVFKLAYYGGKL